MAEKAATKQDNKIELEAENVKLKKELDRLKIAIKNKRFGLIWLNIPEEFEEKDENAMPVLKEVPEKAIIKKDDKPTHILIEGDNYHSLTCLNYTHRGKIDVIYIDPPYNTGSDGFKYRDKRIVDKFPDGTPVPKDHPLRHSYWLSFMAKRLELAKNLLKKEGVLFISINEDELFNLKQLCDKVFGEAEYLTCFSVKVRHEDRILKGDKDFHEVIEYLLMYRKSSAFKTIKRIQSNTSISEYQYEIKLRGKPKIEVFGGKKVEIYQKEQFEINKLAPAPNRLKRINIRGSIKEGNSSGRFYMKYIEGLKNKAGTLYKVPDVGADGLGFRFFLGPMGERRNGDYFQGIPTERENTKEVPYPNFMDFEEDFNNVGYEGGIDFRNGKKPIKFIKYIIMLGSKEEKAVILDFFAGSGTTAHAVIEMNREDGGNRQCIICTNNENNICEEVTYPRIDRIINGYPFEGKEKELLYTKELNLNTMREMGDILGEIESIKRIEGNKYDKYEVKVKDNSLRLIGIKDIKGKKEGLGGSLKYYRTDFIGKNNVLNATDFDKVELAHQAGDLLSIAENTLYKVKENEYWQLYENGERYTSVYFREELDQFEKFVAMVEKLKRPVTVYVFSWGDDEFDDEFEHIEGVKVKTIPLPILEIYKNIYNIG